MEISKECHFCSYIIDQSQIYSRAQSLEGATVKLGTIHRKDEKPGEIYDIDFAVKLDFANK